MNEETMKKVFDITVTDNTYVFATSIETAILRAETELESIEESINSIKVLRSECDKLDYILAASSGVICGIVDIFLVGKSNESPIGDISDKWFADRTKDFARFCGWKDDGTRPLSSAIRFLERVFKVPYDQSFTKDIFKEILDLTPSNHHFKSLSHNMSLLGLFFSILDQFNETSHFVSTDLLITLEKSCGDFMLRGKNIPSKIFCGIANWFGHIMSDISGSHSSKGRGMGIPSPLWTWTNDIIAVKETLRIPHNKFDDSMNEIALTIFEKGYDTRFQAAQAIPVLINEMVVRLIYSIRRLVKFLAETDKECLSFKDLWSSCEPFSNPTVKRMLTVAHGTFCAVDLGDAIVSGIISSAGSFNSVEFFLRWNIVGVGRFSISLFGELKQEITARKSEQEILLLKKEKAIVENYIDGLKLLADIYDDKNLLTFIEELEQSDLYLQAFNKSVKLAEKRNVPEDKLVKNKADIDSYFLGDKM